MGTVPVALRDGALGTVPKPGRIAFPIPGTVPTFVSLPEIGPGDSPLAPPPLAWAIPSSLLAKQPCGSHGDSPRGSPGRIIGDSPREDNGAEIQK